MAVDNNTNMEIKQGFIQKQLHQTYATVADWLNTIFFAGMPTASGIINHIQLSSKMTNLFENTKINVMVISSKQPNIFTFAGQPKTSSLFNGLLTRFRNPFFAKLGGLIHVFGMFESLITAIQIKGIGDDIDHIEYNQDSKKFKMNLQEVTVYISSAIIDTLSNDEEIIALLISEVGQNANLGRHIIANLLFDTSGIGIIFGSLFALLIKFMEEDTKRQYRFVLGARKEIEEGVAPFYTICAVTIMASLFGYFYAVYMSKKTRQYSDEFAVKCGYGSAFNSAIQKVHGFIFDSSIYTEAVRGLNFFDRVLHFLNKIGTYIINFFSNIGLLPTLSTGTRERLASTATNRIQDLTNNNDMSIKTTNESRNIIIERFKRNAVIIDG